MLNNLRLAHCLTMAHRIVLRVALGPLGFGYFLMARWFDLASGFSKQGNLALLFSKLRLQGGDWFCNCWLVVSNVALSARKAMFSSRKGVTSPRKAALSSHKVCS